MRFPRVLPVILGVLVSTAARADPRLDEKVYSPYILKGIAELEVRSAQQVGGSTGGDRTTVLEAEYGISDRLSLAGIAAIERSPQNGSRFSGVGIEAVYYVGQVPSVGIDVGLYGEYKRGLSGNADVLEGKLLLAKNIDRFQGLLNLIVERPLGSRGEGFSTYGYAASATWRTAASLRLGAEAFGNLGSDRDFLGGKGGYIGPQVLWEARPKGLPFEVDIDAGWLFPFGVDRTDARSQVRIGIGLEKRF
jgi:hypothetical protein